MFFNFRVLILRMELLDGRKTSNQIKEELADKVNELKAAGKKTPHLVAVIVGENGASITYVNAKVKACKKVGFESTLIQLPETISEADLLSQIDQLNKNGITDGNISILATFSPVGKPDSLASHIEVLSPQRGQAISSIAIFILLITNADSRFVENLNDQCHHLSPRPPLIPQVTSSDATNMWK